MIGGPERCLPASRGLDASRREPAQRDRAGAEREATYQAGKLRDFTRRGGNPARWWQSEDFTDAHAGAVRTALRKLQEGER